MFQILCTLTLLEVKLDYSLFTVMDPTISELLLIQRQSNGTVFCPSNSDLNMMQWNINRVINKMNEIELCIDSFPGTIHIIAISETWLSPANVSHVRLLDYREFHNIQQHRSGGGMCFFVHESLATDILPQILVDVVTDDLNHFIAIQIPSINITAAVAYRHPGGSKATFLSELETHVLHLRDCHLMGDFNLDLRDLALKDELLDKLESNGFGILNNFTDTTRLVSGSIIDVTATNVLSRSYKFSVVHNPRSDHSVTYTSMSELRVTSLPSICRKKLNIPLAVEKIEHLCDNSHILCGNQLNIQLVPR